MSRTDRPLRRLLRGAAVAACAAFIGCNHSENPAGNSAAAGGTFADARRAQCVMKSPYLQVLNPAAPDAPGRLEWATPTVGAPASCQGNQEFRYGSGLYDITGVVANTSGMGWENPAQVFSGLHTRQYARAFAIESPCNGKRVMFVDTDTGMIFGTVRLRVLELIAANPELAPYYHQDNILLSATHTHSGPAGYSHYLAFNLLHLGYDDATFQVTANGIYEAIRLAHANLQAHPQASKIKLATGELLNTNINRSLPAFNLNPEEERREFLNERGEQIETNKRVVQLNFVRDNGSPVGVINWFGVHPTIIGPASHTVSADQKGYAGLGFERIMRTDYNAETGPDNFVAAFSQADEGDSSPNILIRERPYPDPTRGGGKDDYESSAISGTKHLAKGLELYSEGAALSGPVDYRFFFVDMENVTVTDPVVLASLKHPAEMNADVIRTCTGALGPSFGAGAEDGPGPLTEGLNCNADPNLLERAAIDLQTLLTVDPSTLVTGGFPPHVVPLQVVSAAAMCNLSKLPPIGRIDWTCQAEKPIALPTGGPFGAEPGVLPLQIVRLGNLALIALPWEVTTMSARRIRKLMLEELAPVGVDTVVVVGLANDFVHYLPTREEYASQQYEGGSAVFGPWTLAAVQQETRKLAVSLREGTPAPQSAEYQDGTNYLSRTPYIPFDIAPPGSAFGTLVTDVPATVTQGDTVTAEFQAGHPRNDLRTQASYVYAERQRADGSWEIVAQDRDPELVFMWNPTFPQVLPIDVPVAGSGLTATASAVWQVPRDTPAGTYRLRMEGASWASPLSATTPYSGVSSSFQIEGTPDECP